MIPVCWKPARPSAAFPRTCGGDPLPTRQEKEAAAKKQAEKDGLPDRVAEVEDALCEQDAANEKRLADIETALCELDAALNKE